MLIAKHANSIIHQKEIQDLGVSLVARQGKDVS